MHAPKVKLLTLRVLYGSKFTLLRRIVKEENVTDILICDGPDRSKLLLKLKQVLGCFLIHHDIQNHRDHIVCTLFCFLSSQISLFDKVRPLDVLFDALLMLVKQGVLAIYLHRDFLPFLFVMTTLNDRG